MFVKENTTCFLRTVLKMRQNGVKYLEIRLIANQKDVCLKNETIPVFETHCTLFVAMI